MNLSDCLPEYFAVKNPEGYYIYQNTVFQSSKTHNMPASVLWPIVNASIGTLSYYTCTPTKKPTLTRKWNGDDYYPCSWLHTGAEIDMTKGNGSKLLIPVITILANLYDILPYNNKPYTPTKIVLDLPARLGIDTTARFFQVDPVETVPGLNLVKKPANDTSVESVIPVHVKQILIADAVRNKVDCAISCDPITLTNATVTSCGHVFVSTEIKKWLSMGASKGLCPVCKQKCSA
jgi:hypothetical protein